VPTLLVEIAIRLTFAVMFIASLSFLGWACSAQPELGRHGRGEQGPAVQLPAAVLVPAIAIAVLAISVNLIADALTISSRGRQGRCDEPPGAALSPRAVRGVPRRRGHPADLATSTFDLRRTASSAWPAKSGCGKSTRRGHGRVPAAGPAACSAGA